MENGIEIVPVGGGKFNVVETSQEGKVETGPLSWEKAQQKAEEFRMKKQPSNLQLRFFLGFLVYSLLLMAVGGAMGWTWKIWASTTAFMIPLYAVLFWLFNKDR